MRFRDRTDAGRRLATAVQSLAPTDPVVLGLPRGGVPVAFEVAKELAAPLDVLLVRKLGAPQQPELAFGAVGEGGVVVFNADILRQLQLRQSEIEHVVTRERDELERRAETIRHRFDRVPLSDAAAIVVDDGLATGATARAACQVARSQGAARIVLAVPTAPHSTFLSGALLGGASASSADVDDFIALQTPRRFQAVGQWYDDFSATTDEEVVQLLAEARAWR